MQVDPFDVYFLLRDNKVLSSKNPIDIRLSDADFSWSNAPFVPREYELVVNSANTKSYLVLEIFYVSPQLPLDRYRALVIVRPA